MNSVLDPAPPTYDLPTRARRTDFVAEGRAFAARHRGDAAFRFLRRVLRADEAGLDLVMGKIWCDAHPNMYGPPEGLAASCAKLLAQPFYYLLRKRLARTRGPQADYDVETVDAGYFERWQKPFCDRLPGRLRVTPSAEMLDWVAPGTLARMFAAPLFLPALLRLSRRHGRNLVAPYRTALGTFASFAGHFRRWPARRYLAYADDHNHPCRYLAFHREGGERMSLLQNGERTLHPVYAFGATDDYLAFGRVMETLAPELGMAIGRVIPVGALYMNRRLSEMPELARVAKDIDVLFIDQMTWPHNGFDEATGRAYERSFLRLSELQRARPALRIAYQLRHYRDAPLREAVLARVRPRFAEPIEILGNDGAGESYRNVARARVVVTFQSTMGYEAFFVGRGTKVLFANFTDNPYELYCDDPRFQLFDPSPSPERFVRHVDYLLALRLEEPPPAARERHAFVDGKVAKRVAAALTRD